jgi:tetratricopeptide (TPR) repeat protein
MRVLFLLLLISAGIYVYAMIKQEQIENPFAPIPVPPTPTRSALSYASEAEEFYLQGKLAEAIVAYERAVALGPGDVLLYIPLARLLTLEGQTVEAVRHAQQAVDVAPENARAWAVLGMAYDWNGDVPEAIDACKRAVELDPTYAEAYAYLAEAYIDAGRWADATETAQTAIQLDDRSVDAHRNYGYVLEIQGNYWAAVEAYERALEIHPNLAYIHIAVGKNYSTLGNLEAATRSYERAAEIDPDNVEAFYRLGRAYYDIGENERAETYFNQAIEADPEFAPAFGYLAFTYYRRRNYEGAIENLEPAIELACLASRRQAETFYVTIEEVGVQVTSPSPGVVMRGDFISVSSRDEEKLQAQLAPKDENDEAWADARGTVTLDPRTGEYTVTLEALPSPGSGRVYVGWFDGVNTLADDPLSTGSLNLRSDGSLEAELETGWVEGPRIEYFYTLGLVYCYMAETETQYAMAYPLFDAALQIDPEEENALKGIELCQEFEAQGAESP